MGSSEEEVKIYCNYFILHILLCKIRKWLLRNDFYIVQFSQLSPPLEDVLSCKLSVISVYWPASRMPTQECFFAL